MKKERFKLVPAVYLILMRGDKVLLSLRQNTGFADGLYGLVAGHLEGNESATEGLCREVCEEIGVVLDPAHVSLKVTMHRTSPDRESMDLFFMAEADGQSIENSEPDKCGALAFFLMDDLPDNTVPYVRAAIEAFVEKRAYVEWGWERD